MYAHVDADAFFASVLVRRDPRLRGKPLLALGMGGGCVIAASYEAKAHGVKTGMRLKDALQLCPHALQKQSNFHEAALASREIASILERQCPSIEQMSVDEWFLDLRTLPGGIPADQTAWANRLQEEIRKRTSLTVSIGVAPTKLLAKMAGEYRKPAGITVLWQTRRSKIKGNLKFHCSNLNIPLIFDLEISEFLRDRPAAAIPGIGRRRMIHADVHGWETAWDIAQAPPETLLRLFGRPGVELKQELLGHAVHGIEEEAPPKSVSRCRSFRATTKRDVLWAHILRHAEYTVMKMRRDDLTCRGLSVWLRRGADAKYEHAGANVSLPQPMNTVAGILPFLRQCFARVHRAQHTYTQTGLALWNLIPAGAPQYSLFEQPANTERDHAVQQTLDVLHNRFGRNSVTRGSALTVKTGTNIAVDVSVYE